MIYIKKGLFDNLDLNTEDFEFKNFIKGKESLTKYQNKKYPSPNLMTDTQLFDFRFRQKEKIRNNRSLISVKLVLVRKHTVDM